MCGRGRFAILAACLLNQYAQPCRRRSKRMLHNEASVDSIHTNETKESQEMESSEERSYPIVENFSPGMECPVLYKVIEESDGRSSLEVENMVWGIIPTYLDPPTANDHYRMFNKRIESLERKEVAPYFKTVLQMKRCVVIMDGFYEWKLVAGKKHPHYVSLGPTEPMCMAGIYEDSTIFDPKTYSLRQMKTFSIITGNSCAKFSPMHNRQPILLSPAQVHEWLDCPADRVFTLLEELKMNHTKPLLPMNRSIRFFPVTPKVTTASYQESDCSIEKPIGIQLTTFFKTHSSPKTQRIEAVAAAASGARAGGSLVAEETVESMGSLLNETDDDDITQEDGLTSDSFTSPTEVPMTVLPVTVNAESIDNAKNKRVKTEHLPIVKEENGFSDNPSSGNASVEPALNIVNVSEIGATPVKTSTITSEFRNVLPPSSPLSRVVVRPAQNVLNGNKSNKNSRSSNKSSNKSSSSGCNVRAITNFFAPSPRK